MRTAMFSRMPPMMKLAAALLVAAVLIGTGWAAEKIYLKFNGMSVTLATWPGRSVTLPDGATLNLGGGTFVHEETGSAVSGTPKAVEAAKRHYEEQNKLIAEKKYKLLKTVELFSQKNYVYAFTYADGSHDATTVDLPLETVTSWDDYQKKETAQTEKICKAVVAGKFRLIDVNVIQHHTCRDVDSNEKLDVHRLVYPGQADRAQATVQSAKEPKQMQEMSWRDHLKAIREGKRELLGSRNDTLYTYEAVLEDGSKVTFVQDHPLKALETK